MAPSALNQIFRPRCPQCGQGLLFKDTLNVVDACSACGLVLKHHDAADAPAFFSICIIGFLVVLFASIVEMRYMPPLWVHAALWVPFTLIGSLLTLRIIKAIMITLQYRLAQLKGNPPHDAP